MEGLQKELKFLKKRVVQLEELTKCLAHPDIRYQWEVTYSDGSKQLWTGMPWNIEHAVKEKADATYVFGHETRKVQATRFERVDNGRGQ